MQVVGETTQQYVWVATDKRKISINEILIIEDKELGNVRGEVVETLCYNRYIPLNLNGSLMEAKVIESLSNLGYDIGGNEISIGKLRFFSETPFPVSTGSSVRSPKYHEVKDILVFASKDEGLVLGEIKSTQNLYESLPLDLKGISPVDENGIISQRGVPIIFPIREMHQYPHIGIFGGSGSGKSYGIRVILEEIMKFNIPMLIFDPHYEMEFNNDNGLYGEKYINVRLGQDVGVEFSQLSIRDIVNLLGASHTLTESMVNAIEMLHKKNDSLLTFGQRIDDLIKAMELGKGNLDRLARDNMEQDLKEISKLSKLAETFGSIPLSSLKGIQWRLRRLENAGLFNHDIDIVSTSLCHGKSVVVQGPVWLLGVFATYVISHFYHKRRQFKDGSKNEFFPPFLVVTDEAHNFAPKGYDSPAKTVVKEIAQEGRKYGVFLILATQRPTLLDETVTAQLNTKFIFRTVRGTDISTIREETDLTEQESKRLPYLRSGDVFISSAIFGRTIASRIRIANTYSPHSQNPFDELKDYFKIEESKLLDLLKPHFPFNSVDLNDVLLQLEKEGVKSIEELIQSLQKLQMEGHIKIEKTPFGDRFTLNV